MAHYGADRFSLLQLIAFSLVIALLALANKAVAIEFKDGGTHDIAGGFGGIDIHNNTTVNFTHGSSVGTLGGSIGFSAALLRDTSTLSVVDAYLIGGSYGIVVGDGVTARGGNLNVFGGKFLGGNSTNFVGEGIQAINTKMLVSGGVIQGGSSGKRGGNGARIYNGISQITGGIFLGGSGSLSGGDGADFRGGVVDIRGGVFRGGDSGGGDGLIINDVQPLSISGGTFEAGVSDRFFGVAASIRGSTVGTISGGSFIGDASSSNYVLRLYDDAVVDLMGGHFSGTRRIVLYDNAVLNVFGRLNFQGGVLSGTLADGNSVNLLVSLRDSSQLNLVPEPTSATLVVLCALVFRCRRCVQPFAGSASRPIVGDA